MIQSAYSQASIAMMDRLTAHMLQVYNYDTVIPQVTQRRGNCIFATVTDEGMDITIGRFVDINYVVHDYAIDEDELFSLM